MKLSIIYITLLLLSQVLFSCNNSTRFNKTYKSMAYPVPKEIDSAKVISYIILDSTQTKTNKTTHYVSGKLVKDVYGLAICKYPEDTGFYLFYCNDRWGAITDTYHNSLASAKEQAEFEYSNTTDSWKSID